MKIDINTVSEYYEEYVRLVHSLDHIEALDITADEIIDLLSNITEQQSTFRYAENKWSIRELAGHLIDSERVFSYRALRISRGDTMNLWGFDENTFIKESNYDSRSFNSILSELKNCKRATNIMFENMTDNQLNKIGMACEIEITPLALAFGIAGHTRHHCRILKDRYLTSLNGADE